MTGSAPDTASATGSAMRRLAPVLIVPEVEPCLGFWQERLGFACVARVPHGEELGFAILARDGVEVMYQSEESVAADIPAASVHGGAPRTSLYIEVDDVDAVDRALGDMERVVPRRRTFYGMEEVGVREPGGHVVLFAQRAPGDS